jgi:DNA-binding transcriptional regulator GbsR (MarR family)
LLRTPCNGGVLLISLDTRCNYVTLLSEYIENMNNTNSEAQARFLRCWGEMGSCWGINKTMAQIHALLMVHEEPLSTDDVMKELQISRGNANMNLRGLVDWGLVRRSFLKGDRKEYFQTEKDVWKMFCTISRERKKREIEPVITALEECLSLAEKDKDSLAFRKQVEALLEFIKTGDFLLGKIAQQEKNRVMPLLVKLLGSKEKGSFNTRKESNEI